MSVVDQVLLEVPFMRSEVGDQVRRALPLASSSLSMQLPSESQVRALSAKLPTLMLAAPPVRYLVAIGSAT